MSENINISVENGVKEIVIREGRAAELLPLKSVTIEGDIHTPSEYFKLRQHLINHDTAIAIFDKKKMSITLDTEPFQPITTVIVGKIEMSDELNAFAINKQKTFTREELVKLIRFNRRFFADRDEAEQFHAKLSNFAISANIENRQASDMRGNKASHLDKSVKTDLPNTVKFFMPIFKNGVHKEFIADVCVDTTETSARFWFESLELDAIISDSIETIFDDAKGYFSESGIPIINQ